MKYFFPLLLLCLTQFTFADQLIIEPERGRAPLIEAMNGAHHTIHLVMYGFTDKTLLNTLLWQKRRGITTEVLLENNPYRFTDQNNATIAQLNSNHVALQQKAAHFYLVHQKTLIIDDKEAIVMTFNFTQSTFKRTRNFALVVTDPQLVHDINAVFLADWQHKPTPPHAAPLIYSPDDSREKLIAAIHTAKHSLKIYAQTVSDYAIIRALADAANHGVQVVILTSNPIQAKKVALLKKAGVKIKRMQHLYVHAKAWLIDDTVAIIGSTNLTRSSLDANRELSVLTRDPTVIRQLNDVFEQDYSE